MVVDLGMRSAKDKPLTKKETKRETFEKINKSGANLFSLKRSIDRDRWRFLTLRSV
jgi:hypothetical protein